MTRYGSAYVAARDKFKSESAARNDPCWICRGPIDYTSAHDPQRYNPKLFELDHATPTSLGGSIANPSNFRASCKRCNARRGNSDRGLFRTSRQW